MTIYVTGYRGRVGQLLLRKECLPLECDVTDYDSVESAITKFKPSVVAHLACKSDVDWCEQQINKEEVIKVNVRGVHNVADVCRKNSCTMVLLSTDHVFDGKKGPYPESHEYWRRNLLYQFSETPVNFYGLTRVGAEGLRVAFPNMKIVRTSYLFDNDRMSQVKNWIDFPTFIFRSFMWTEHFAQAFKAYLDRVLEMPTILHISGSQTVSWYDFILAWASIVGVDKNNFIPRTKEWKKTEIGLKAPRPKKAGLVTRLSARKRIPQYSYLDGLKEMINGNTASS